MKYKIVKAIDVAGLNFLTPVVRLAYGEEPRKQLKEIGQFIVIPAIAICLFIAAWSVVAKNIKTKSGQLPGPTATAESASAIWNFHVREGLKEDAYVSDPELAKKQLADAKARLEMFSSYSAKAADQLAAADAANDASIAASIAPLVEKLDAAKAGVAALQAERSAKIDALGASLAADDRSGRENLLEIIRAHAAKKDVEKEKLSAAAAVIDDLRGTESAELVAATKLNTAIAEERQFLAKLVEQFEKGRAVKIAGIAAKLKEQKIELISAAGSGVASAAASVVKTQDRAIKIAGSTYAKPYTLPMQVLRSILCVFVGFLIGTAIAIPIGVLCGLSKTFMAAMTPFIALFKPVSPIVWLPIALIVVGGFIEDPENHPLMVFFAELPLIGWMKINPAFIASAITVALCSLWATMTNTALGVASIDKDHLNVAKVLRLGFWERLFKIVIPSALPLMFAGMRISLGVGWMVLIAAELLASSEGIGKFVWDQFNNGASDSFAKMVVVVFVVGAIGLLLDRIMIVFQRLVSFDGAPTAV